MKKDININGDIYGVGVAQDGSTINQEITLPPHKVPKKLTPQTGLANDIDFVGRKEELQKVDELLNQNSMLLLLNGIGGIGKSTLASYYLNQHKDNFDYYGFVQVNEDIKLSLASAFGTSLDLKSEKIDDLFAEIMNKLQNLEGKKLLIIDDVKEMDNQQDEMNTLITLKNSGFQILFTSRETKEYIPQYFLDIMSIEDARELFLKHYPTNEMDKVDKILEYLDYHTLFIEITAKTLKKRKNTLSLDIAIEKFDNGEFTAVKRNKSESFNKFLKNFSYDSAMLTQKKNLLFLKRLSVLPSIEISFEDLYKFLVCEDKDRLEDFLIELVDNGWLIESENSYKFHQILKEFVLDSYTLVFHEVETQLDYFNKLMKNSGNKQVIITNKRNIIFFESFYNLLKKINMKHLKIFVFLIDLGNIYRFLEKYEKAEMIFYGLYLISEHILGTEDPISILSINALAGIYKSNGKYKDAEFLYLSIIKINEKLHKVIDLILNYNNLGELYRIIKKYKKAEFYFIKALAILETLPEHKLKIATTRNNLALVYMATGKYKTAEALFISAIKINLNLSGKKDINTINYYANLGELYMYTHNYNHAIAIFKEVLTFYEGVLGNKDSSIAIIYNNLAITYSLMKIYDKVDFYHKKALEIRKEVLGEEHFETGLSYNNLGYFYYTRNEFDKAYKYIKKAIDVWGKILYKEHPDLVTAKEILESIRLKNR